MRGIGPWGSRVRRRGLAWPILVFVVAYLTLFTQDLRLGAVPLKVPLVVVALVVWWLERGRSLSLAHFRCSREVLALGIAVPVIWSFVAVITRAIGSDVALIDYGDIVEEASRFGYVLLYFPLADLLEDAASTRHRGWLWPILGLAVITWLLWAGMAVVDAGYRERSTVLAFSGVFSEQDTGFRVFIANQVLFVPALCLLLVRALQVRWSWPTACGLALLLSASYHAHTRGLWIALLAAGSALVLFQWAGLMRLLAQRAIAWVLPGLVTLAIAASSAVLLTEVVDLPGFLDDQSAGSRVSQASVLFDGWSNQPVLGSGLGARPKGGYVRSIADPWSFELTYLQVLFQIGAVGLLVLLWALTSLFTRTIRTFGRSRTELGQRELSVAGFATLAGVFVASATNPYLLSAFGMLCIALGLALADLGLRSPAATDRPGSARPPGLPVVGVVIALAAVLTGLELAGERT